MSSFKKKIIQGLSIQGGINISNNINEEQLLKLIKDYSFRIYPSFIKLMEIANHDIILICSYQENIPKSTNGILFINPSLGKNQFVKLLYTKNYEIHCFQQYDNKDKKNPLSQYYYFGRIDHDKRIGILNLFRIGQKSSNTEIEYVMNITLKGICLQNLGYIYTKKIEDYNDS